MIRDLFEPGQAWPEWHKAVVDIRALKIIQGDLPRRAAQLVLDWAELHQDERIEDWDLCQAEQLPKPIAPLK